MASFGLTLLLLLSLLPALHVQAPAPPAVRLHHIHLRVDDPAAAMNAYAKTSGCTKTIVQGLGVGVRCGDQYILFDRRDTAANPPAVPGSVMISTTAKVVSLRAVLEMAGGDDVTRWMRDELGFDVRDALRFSPPVGTKWPSEIAHVAIGVRDPAPVVARLVAHGTRVLSKTEDATIVAGPAGLAVEIVRDAGPGPDAFWCPMHPDQRSPSPGTCPICKMTFVAIPPPVFGDAHLSVEADAAPTQGATQRLTLRLTDRDGKPITSLVSVHERPLHLFVVGRDLAFFDHVHPVAGADGTFTVDVALPTPDVYAVFADFYPLGGTPQLLQTMFVSPGYRGDVFPPANAPRPDATDRKTSSGLTVALAATDLRAGREQALLFTLTDGTTGAPVTDLEPYLGAAGHLFVLSADLSDALHSHPTELAGTGPTVAFGVTFPHAGTYKVWVQFQRGGTVVTTPFVVAVK